MEINYEHIENILATALEGGSNYWYLLKADSVKVIFDATPQLSGRPLSIRMALVIWESEVAIPVYDVEGGLGKLGEITKESLIAAINAYEKDRGCFDPENFDAEEADWIFQYAVMGEIVFG